MPSKYKALDHQMNGAAMRCAVGVSGPSATRLKDVAQMMKIQTVTMAKAAATEIRIRRVVAFTVGEDLVVAFLAFVTR